MLTSTLFVQLFNGGQKNGIQYFFIRTLTINVNIHNFEHKSWKTSFCTRFAPSQPCVILTKYFYLTQVCILPLFMH